MLKYVIATGLTISLAAFAENVCRELEGATPQVQLDYLQRDRATLNPSCVAYAMYSISLMENRAEFDRYQDAVKTFVRYLDYRLPDEGTKYTRAVASNRDPYPASSALINAGKAAVPRIIEAVASSETSDTGRRNALTTLSAIYSEDSSEVVRVLRRASKAFPDWAASQRLWEAARKVSICKGPREYACRDALYENDIK